MQINKPSIQDTVKEILTYLHKQARASYNNGRDVDFNHVVNLYGFTLEESKEFLKVFEKEGGFVMNDGMLFIEKFIPKELLSYEREHRCSNFAESLYAEKEA